MLLLKYLKVENSLVIILVIIYCKNIDYYYRLKTKLIFNKIFAYKLKY